MKKKKLNLKEEIFIYKTLIKPLFQEEIENININDYISKEEQKALRKISKKEKIEFLLLIEYLAYKEMVSGKLNIFNFNKETLQKDNIFYITDEIQLKVL